jgi:tRNA pseudouridine38-40 synthase
MPTYRMDLAYDGTDFHGYARQDNVRTVQGDLEAALVRRVGPVNTVVAGRTDRGVHAAGQVVSFSVGEPLDVDALQRSLNRQLGPEVAVFSIAEVADDFSARFSATGRRYRYRIWNGPVIDPLAARSAWHVAAPLDVHAMDRAVGGLIGTHDFASFCRQHEGRSTRRELREATWERFGDFVELSIAANAFCHQMVRSIVAISVEVGLGAMGEADVVEILEARDRSVARGCAPPWGLTLISVSYDAANPAGFSAGHVTP